MGLWPFSYVAGASDEASVRVAIVYNFIKFIEWPDQSAAPSFRLCTLGATGGAKNALQQLKGQPVLTQLVDRKPVVKQAVELVYLDDPSTAISQLKTCHMLYRPARSIPIDMPQPLPGGVLFVADDPQPSEENVGIALVRNSDGHMEFSISQTAVNQAGVSISSQLWKLARNSRGGKK